MKTYSTFFTVLMASLLLTVFVACSVNDGESESDGDTEQTEADGDSDLEGGIPDGDSDVEAADGDQTTDDDSDSDEVDGDAETTEEAEMEAEKEVEVQEDTEVEVEAEIEDAPLCGDGLILSCGDSLAHNTNVEGRVDEWFGYSCSARAEGGREAIYTFSTEEDCSVVLRLTDLSVDIDLFLLSECDPFSCIHMSSTPLDIQDDETVEFETEAGTVYFVSVDGYSDAAGSYTIEAECTCGVDGDETCGK